jgi:hypothetical protein
MIAVLYISPSRDEALSLWNITSGDNKTVYKGPELSRSIGIFSSDLHYFTASGYRLDESHQSPLPGSVLVPSEEISLYDTSYHIAVRNFSAADYQFVAGSHNIVTFFAGETYVRDCDTWRVLARVPGQFERSDTALFPVVSDHDLTIIDGVSGETLVKLKVAGTISDVSVSKKYSKIAVTYYDRDRGTVVGIYDPSGLEINSFIKASEAQISSDDQTLSLKTDDGNYIFYNLRNDREMMRVSPPWDKSKSTFGPRLIGYLGAERQTAAFYGGSNIEMYSLATGAHRSVTAGDEWHTYGPGVLASGEPDLSTRAVQTHEPPIRFSADGRRIAVAVGDRVLIYLVE